MAIVTPMDHWRSAFRRYPGLVLGVLLLALAARVVVPPGFMPAQAAAGLEICWGGTAPLLLGADDHGAGGGTHDRVHAPCAFASLATAVVLPSSSVLLLAPVVRAESPRAPGTALPAARSAHLRPPLRGPPVLA